MTTHAGEGDSLSFESFSQKGVLATTFENRSRRESDLLSLWITTLSQENSGARFVHLSRSSNVANLHKSRPGVVQVFQCFFITMQLKQKKANIVLHASE